MAGVEGQIETGIPARERAETQPTMEESVNAQAFLPTESESLHQQGRARCRFVLSILVHFAAVTQVVMTLLLFWLALNAMYFVAILVLTWGFNTLFCTRIAWQQRRLENWPLVFRLPAVVVVYGLLQWVQVEHIWDCYVSRRDGKDKQGLFHRKTFDSITVAFPFAIITLWAFFLLGTDSPAHCPWHNSIREDWLGGETHTITAVRWLLATSYFQSCASIALGSLEADYRVSESIAQNVEKSPCRTFVHVLCRGSEASMNITTLVLLCVFIRPALQFETFGISFGPLLACVPTMFECFLNAIILSCPCTAGRPSCLHLFRIAFVAFSAIVVNPVAFMGDLRYARQALRASWMLRAVKVARIVALACIMWCSRAWYFPETCGVDDKLTMWENFRVHQCNLLYISIASLVCCMTTRLFLFTQRHKDSAVRPFIPLMCETEEPGLRSRIRNAELTGDLSNFLLQLTGVFSNNMIHLRDDFEIHPDKLGSGSHGEVVKVTLKSTQQEYALKLVYDPLPACRREVEVLTRITDLTHVFLVRLLLAFEIPPDIPDLRYSDGRVVESSPGRRFQYAIMMSFVDGENLQDYIAQERWKEERASRAKRMRIFGAELATVLDFLHANKIAFRDLKPDNVLVRRRSAGRVHPHICLTDFGFAKHFTAEDPLKSLAGNDCTTAREVFDGRYNDPARPDKRTRFLEKKNYDSAVDVYSYAAMYLLMSGMPSTEVIQMRNEVLRDGILQVLERSPEKFPTVDIPQPAVPLLWQCLDEHPERRPTMKNVAENRFFTHEVKHGSECLEPINIQDYMDDAALA